MNKNKLTRYTRIAEIRQKTQMKIMDFCEYSGISRNTYYSYYYGTRKIPKYIIKLLDFIEEKFDSKKGK